MSDEVSSGEPEAGKARSVLNYLPWPPLAAGRAATVFWYLASLAIAVVYALPAYQTVFRSGLTVEDDAREHVFWMERFLDPGLFPNDLIASYFQAVSPPAFNALYRVFALGGVDPLVLSRVLPFALALVGSTLCYLLALRLLPLPIAAFVSTALMNQSFWTKDDIISATPRAFFYPIVLAFLYCLARRWLLASLVFVGLEALFYPQLTAVFLGVLVLRLLSVRGWKPLLIGTRNELVVAAAGIVLAVVLVLPSFLSQQTFGPTIDGATARSLPEFGFGGRTEFFVDDPPTFWLRGERSGYLPFEWNLTPLLPPQAYLAPLLLVCLLSRGAFPLVRRLDPSVRLLADLTLAGTFMYFVAHALIFRLHVPSRYSQMSLRIVLALAAGVALVVLLEGLYRWPPLRRLGRYTPAIATAACSLLAAHLVLDYPAIMKSGGGVYPYANYRRGTYSDLYQFLQSQPKDALIASIDEEVNNLPTFGRRSILTGREYAIPFHLGFYWPFRQRSVELIRALYSPRLDEARALVDTYRVTLFLFDKDTFSERYLTRQRWVMKFDETAEVLRQFHASPVAALAAQVPRCQVFAEDNLVLVDARCAVTPPAAG